MSQAVIELLVTMETELRQQNVWSALPPSPEAMAGDMPFCVDTMAFSQWLQWIFIPRMRALIDAKAPLPKGANITSYAEESLRFEAVDAAPILRILAALEGHLN